jgi:hypothetical protein
MNKIKIRFLQKLKLLPPPTIVAEPCCRKGRFLNNDLKWLLHHNCLEKRKKFGIRVPCEYLMWLVDPKHPVFVNGIPRSLANLMGWDAEAHKKAVAAWWKAVIMSNRLLTSQKHH